jgi:hypothetical protein
MNRLVLAALLIPAVAAPLAHAHAESIRVTVEQDLAIARPSETISIPWKDVNAALPGAMVQKIAVKDARGRVLPHQVTNIAPQAKDPKNEGVAYGELLFQHSFAAGEKSAGFTIERIDGVAPPFPIKTFARQVPERLDDFAWENDKIAHRTYGPALAAPAPPGVVKEVLVTSGLDIWFKRVDYPIVDRWYNKGHDHYHKDQGEGMDMYNVGKSRGAGGTGVWSGATLYPGVNYASFKILANGPIRTVFELHSAPWDASGDGPLMVAVGLNKTPGDKGQSPKIATTREGKVLLQWVEQTTNDAFGTAVVLPTAEGFAQDALNELIVAKAVPGQPLRYYAGAAWRRAGEITSREQWQGQAAAVAARDASPVRVIIAPAKGD